jgi:diguanylate cyclase (GGDEF)-like protein
LRHQAQHDALTGLPNRLLFQQRFDEMRDRAWRQRRQTYYGAVMVLDLDGFKRVNDSLGHAVGDLLLQEGAARMTSVLRRVDTVARFGGDEFAILLDGIEDAERAAVVARKVLEAFGPPFVFAGHALFVSISIGISSFPTDGEDADTLLKHADVAMYRAKSGGRNQSQFFSAEMNAKALENLLLSSGLRQALQRDELFLVYQPRVDLASGRISGAEALIRWTHPEMGAIPPARFIPLAEESGLIEAIGGWTLKEACRQMRRWQDMGLALDHIAVNLTAREFARPDASEYVAAILDEAGLEARYLELEVTESMMMRKPESAVEVLTRMKRMGITVAIDDFGTGYSSLSYLKRFPLDFLKIDQSFIRGLPGDAEDVAITSAIIAMARSLGVQLIAEGVETDAQREFLRELGTHHGQGYLFSKPVPPVEIERLLRRDAAGD